MSYQAVIAPIHVRPHSNADKLLLGLCRGNQIVVGLDTKEGELGCFFPDGGQLSQDFCDANDLIARFDDQGKKIGGGFFDHKRRVRAQAFRGEKSDGFWVPLTQLSWTGVDTSTLTEGMAFDELNGKPICNKYITQATQRAANAASSGDPRKPKSKSHTEMFPMHFDTPQFRDEVYRLKAGDTIYVLLKMHGTSQRYGHVLDEVEIPLGRVDRAWNWTLGKLSYFRKFRRLYTKWKRQPKTQEGWRHVTGTRRVIRRDMSESGYYGGETFRENVIAPIKGQLKKGEVLFFEVVGWTEGGGYIMATQSLAKLTDKKWKPLKKKYGETMAYTYGCPPGTCKMFVYRIAITTPDGLSIDLPWPAVKKRCAELGINHVPELDTILLTDTPSANEKTMEALRRRMDALVEGEDPIGQSHIREGVCLRVDHGELTPMICKLKSHTFLILEGVLKDSDDYIDREESS